MPTENLKTELEQRNSFLEAKSRELEDEQRKSSQRVSEIQFILTGIKGEIEANKRIIQKLKSQK